MVYKCSLWKSIYVFNKYLEIKYILHVANNLSQTCLFCHIVAHLSVLLLNICFSLLLRRTTGHKHLIPVVPFSWSSTPTVCNIYWALNKQSESVVLSVLMRWCWLKSWLCLCFLVQLKLMQILLFGCALSAAYQYSLYHMCVYHSQLLHWNLANFHVF